MKKTLWLALILLLVCVFAFSSCDSGDTPPTNNENNQQTTDNNNQNTESGESQTNGNGNDTSNTPTECQHTFGSWNTVKQATCKEEGKLVRTCSKCLETEESTVAKTDIHTEVIDAAVSATCTVDGKTEGKHCSVCGKTIIAQTVVKALGHTEVTDKAIAATCTTDGKTEGKHCSRCNETLVAQTTVGKLGHVEVIDAAVAATCTTDGKTEGKHCSVCNMVFVAQKIIYSKECNFNNWSTTKVQTGNAKGVQERKCVECGKVETRSIPTSEPTEIFLGSSTLVIKENEVYTLRPILEPAGSKTKYTFSSSDYGIVTVASAGGNSSCNITGVSAGTATVTITTEYGLSVCCEITVEKTPQPIAIVIPEEIYIKTGEVYHIPIELQPTDSNTLFTISTSDSSIVSANTTGGRSGVCITGISSGEATIVICTSNGIAVSSHIIVEDGIEVSNIIIPEEYTLYQGDDWFIPIELNPTDAQTTYSITTTDSSICDVYTTGGGTGCKVHAYAVGEAIITIFTENGKNASCKIIVLSCS